MTARIPSTTRVPASPTARLRFAWTDEPAARRRRRGRSSVAIALLAVAALALLSLGQQLADGVEANSASGTTGDATAATATNAPGELPVMFAELPDGPTAADLVHGQTIAMAHCDFFADAGCQPFACVVETLADDSQRLVVFGRSGGASGDWAVAFEYRPDPRAEIFRGMLPEDLNLDGVPELTTLWDCPNGGIRTRVLCRKPGTDGEGFLFVTTDPFTLEARIPIVAPVQSATAMRENAGTDDVRVMSHTELASEFELTVGEPNHAERKAQQRSRLVVPTSAVTAAPD